MIKLQIPCVFTNEKNEKINKNVIVQYSDYEEAKENHIRIFRIFTSLQNNRELKTADKEYYSAIIPENAKQINEAYLTNTLKYEKENVK